MNALLDIIEHLLPPAASSISFLLKEKKHFYCSTENQNTFLETEMGFGLNILLCAPSVASEGLNENSLITVPCQVMPPLLTSRILTNSVYLHASQAVIAILSHFSAAVYFSAATICIEIIQLIT